MSLLSIQAKEGNNVKDIDYFVEKSLSRIITISLIHENLYENENLKNIDYKIYLGKLVKNLDSVLNISNKKIDIKINVNSLFLDIQTAVPLGLILNELISNSYKYAFTNRLDGEIEISIIHTIEKKFELIYTDNGIGFPTNETTNHKSLGLDLIQQLTKQLGGKLAKANLNKGVQYKIVFYEAV